MKKTQKIGWQKYEDVLELQINCPLAQQLYQNVLDNLNKQEETLSFEDIELTEQEALSSSAQHIEEEIRVVLDKDFSKEVLLATNYDCWMGHTNFDLTPKIKEVLDGIAGVEVMRICTRYRFFIGVGRMFDFSEVRRDIENKLDLSKEEHYDKF